MMFTNSVPEKDTHSPGSRTEESEGKSMDQGWDSWQGMPCSTKGSKQACQRKTLPKLSLLLYLGTANNVIQDQFLG